MKRASSCPVYGSETNIKPHCFLGGIFCPYYGIRVSDASCGGPPQGYGSVAFIRLDP